MPHETTPGAAPQARTTAREGVSLARVDETGEPGRVLGPLARLLIALARRERQRGGRRMVAPR
jgi:hypothetical protein